MRRRRVAARARWLSIAPARASAEVVPRGLAASRPAANDAPPAPAADDESAAADDFRDADGAAGEEEEAPLAAFDLYGALGVTRAAGGGVSGGRSRCFAAFHARSLRFDPERFRGSAEASEAWTRFRRLGLAFAVLQDDARREVYDAAGFEGLRRSETHADRSAFELDALGVFDDFFDARNPLDGAEDGELREYLLL